MGETPEWPADWARPNPTASGESPQAGEPPSAPLANYGGPPYGAPKNSAPNYGAPNYGAPNYGAPNYGATGFNGPPAYKPGVVPLRPLTLGEILDGGFATIRKHPRIVFGYAAVLATVLRLVALLPGVFMNDVSGSLHSFATTTRQPDGTTNFHVQSAGLATTIVQNVLGAVFAILLAGIVTVVVGKAVIGRGIDGGTVWHAVRERPWPLLVTGMVAALAPWLPFALTGAAGVAAATAGGAALAITLVIMIPLSVAAAIYLWAKLALAVPALMLERLGFRAAIARSWRLVRGAFWRIWGIRALVFVIVAIAGSVIAIPFVLVAGAVGGFSGFSGFVATGHLTLPSIVIISIGGAFAWAFTQPLYAAATTLLYVDRRMRAEGLDLQLSRAAQAPDGSGAAGSTAAGSTAGGGLG